MGSIFKPPEPEKPKSSEISRAKQYRKFRGPNAEGQGEASTVVAGRGKEKLGD